LATRFLYFRYLYDSGVVFVILFTVIFGRIFVDGFVPNHILRNGFCRRIEYWIEGDRGAQIWLSKWNAEKIREGV
jgi:hypothetical protein